MNSRHHHPVGGGSRRARWEGRCGAVLLEVILALALFVFAAAVIGNGLHAALERADRLRRECHAANLAASVMAEVQLGIRPLQNSGREPFPEPFADWTAQVESTPYTFGWQDVAGLSLVTVVVRHEESGTTSRLGALVPAEPIREPVAPPEAAEPGGGFAQADTQWEARRRWGRLAVNPLTATGPPAGVEFRR